MSTFDKAWEALEPAFRRALELAHESMVAGGLPVGATVTDGAGTIVASGRNRAYDPPGGPDPLQGTPLAHAETNALAVARTDWELGDHTLWSTQEPCSMCAAAATFVGVGAVRYLAPDPWSIATDGFDRARVPDSVTLLGPADDVWVVCANLLFLRGIANRAGLDHPTVARNREREPETAAIVVELVTAGATLAATLRPLWVRVTRAAAARAARLPR